MKFALLTLIAAFAVSAHAAPPAHEVQVGAAGNGKFTSEKIGDDNVTTLQLRGSYAMGDRFEQPELQVGAEGGFLSTSGGAKSRSAFELAGFATWNFDPAILESFYVKGGFGTFAYLNTKSEYENKFGFFAGGGGRFPIWGNILYNPEARLIKKDSVDLTFEILFVNVSFLF